VIFSSPAFFPFLAAALLVYWGATAAGPARARRVVQHAALVAASLWFYMSWNPAFVGLILATIVFDWAAALLLDRAASPAGRRAIAAASVTVNLGVLVLFKYANFFLDQVETATSVFGLPASFAVDIVLPIGVSFYTFESMSYVLDVYHRRMPPLASLLDYAVFITFFPHLVAGPIVRLKDFAPQLLRPMLAADVHLRQALRLFLLGLVKKLLISDRVALVSDAVFADPASFDSLGVWIGVTAYTIQIYCDFSGYSDMALGLACLFGYRLPENFDMPYRARNISEFWRRWHITLSSWLRDYLYVPLGGSRGPLRKTYRNLLAVMLLGGLWHGASWTFVVWGGLHGIGLVVHKEWRRRFGEPTPARGLRGRLAAAGAWATTLVFVMVAWVFFRATDFSTAAALLAKMAGFGGPGLHRIPVAWVASVALVVAGHAWGTLRPLAAERAEEPRLPRLAESMAYSVAIALLCVLAPDGTQPFIYFQF